MFNLMNYSFWVIEHLQRLWAATSIVALDENYNRRVAGFQNVESFYEWCSCLPLLPSLRVPMIFLNAEDDPIIPRCLWEPVKVRVSSERIYAPFNSRSGTRFPLRGHGFHLYASWRSSRLPGGQLVLATFGYLARPVHSRDGWQSCRDVRLVVRDHYGRN